MLFQPLYRSPDAEPSGADDAPKPKSRAKSYLPEGQVALAALGLAVAPKYAADVAALPGFGLIWTKPDDLSALATDTHAKVGEAGSTQANRTPNAEAIDKLDAEIMQRLGNVRNYLEGAYEDENDEIVRGYLAQLGFKLQYGSYMFPRGQDDRLAALDQLLLGLVKHGIGGKKYGLAYWTDMRQRYSQALTTAGNDSGTVSTVVDRKNELLDQLREILTGIYYLLRAQFPKSWKAKLRAYGFQEEGY
ncbi:hypothetical protein Q5H93_10590 [Hymenobacter sp. ASUV-10]|uniref:Uncharacterized protein n=1 Tax=Hymenobacter aranciens TaxID=3063996 RepID=A0ABT9BA88_9BACT|nr:hypothetical protein [Hymenobacter sp. ASUV-10]MDO7875179.1 hypothetical protein [Hymenobacter sp. ASUV-10]